MDSTGSAADAAIDALKVRTKLFTFKAHADGSLSVKDGLAKTHIVQHIFQNFRCSSDGSGLWIVPESVLKREPLFKSKLLEAASQELKERQSIARHAWLKKYKLNRLKKMLCAIRHEIFEPYVPCAHAEHNDACASCNDVKDFKYML
jgi:hypothetical protein